jgi:hypothetical protein
MKRSWMMSGALLGVIVLLVEAQAPVRHDVKGTLKGTPYMMTHLFTGPDGQTHAEEIEAKFIRNGNADVFKLMNTAGAELRRAPAGTVSDWHTAPRRQYVITLAGMGEVELADGKKIRLGPGHIDFVEDLTGKGHITRVVGSEDRITLQLPVTDR